MGNNETEIGGTLPQRMSSCLATMNAFLQQPHPVLASMVLADKQKASEGQSQVGLLQAIGNILGIKDVKTVNVNNSLADLGMDSLMGTEIKQTLERNYDIVLSPQEIRGLTFGKLMTFVADSGDSGDTSGNRDDPIDARHSRFIPDLSPIYPRFIPDRRMTREQNPLGFLAVTVAAVTTSATTTSPTESGPAELLFQCLGTEIVPKKSLLQLETRDTKGQPIFVVSAIEGVIASLKGLAGELAMPVWGLQCTKDSPLDSIGSLAKFYVRRMQEVQARGPYNLIGYSFGALVAFEMALQLENLGEDVRLNLLDGSPQFITLHCQTIGKQIGQITESLEDDGTRKALAYFTRQLNSNIGFLKVSALSLRSSSRYVDLLIDMLLLPCRHTIS
jgi:fatty acid synthase